MREVGLSQVCYDDGILSTLSLLKLELKLLFTHWHLSLSGLLTLSPVPFDDCICLAPTSMCLFILYLYMCVFSYSAFKYASRTLLWSLKTFINPFPFLTQNSQRSLHVMADRISPIFKTLVLRWINSTALTKLP